MFDSIFRDKGNLQSHIKTEQKDGLGETIHNVVKKSKYRSSLGVDDLLICAVVVTESTIIGLEWMIFSVLIQVFSIMENLVTESASPSASVSS